MSANVPRLPNPLWFDLLALAVIGGLIIGACGFIRSADQLARRERERLSDQQLIGVELPMPSEEQVLRDRERDFATGAVAGVLIWLVLVGCVLGTRWTHRPRAEPGSASLPSR